MRAKEFITEQFPAIKKIDGSEVGTDVAGHALPKTYVIPDLSNQDFYKLYRFGLAIAATRRETGEKNYPTGQHGPEFNSKSEWGELQWISSVEPNLDQLVDSSLSKIGLKGKKTASTPTSTEIPDTAVVSPIKAFKGYKK